MVDSRKVLVLDISTPVPRYPNNAPNATSGTITLAKVSNWFSKLTSDSVLVGFSLENTARYNGAMANMITTRNDTRKKK
jgi:hypothetical protein